MKRKSPRGVPDFSRQGGATPSRPAGERAAPSKSAAPRQPAPARVKPQSTSAKSGQRGQ